MNLNIRPRSRMETTSAGEADSSPSLAKKAMVFGAVLATSLIASLMVSTSAAASTVVRGCTPSTAQPIICVTVTTGDKNSANHTQWVERVAVHVRTGSPASKVEAWAGNGPTGVAWYNSASSSTDEDWSVNKWIKTDSGICGAYTYTDGSGRAIACITIKA